MSKSDIDRDIEVPLNLLPSLLTPSEWRMIKTRLYIIELLNEGLTIREIAQRAGVGTDTVVRVSRMMKAGDLGKDISKKSSQTSWVFGKSEE
jgi:Trp operon repressor